MFWSDKVTKIRFLCSRNKYRGKRWVDLRLKTSNSLIFRIKIEFFVFDLERKNLETLKFVKIEHSITPLQKHITMFSNVFYWKLSIKHV